MNIRVSPELRQACPGFVGVAVLATLHNTPHSAPLWEEIHSLTEACRQRLTPDTLKTLPSIQATREAYKALGKDPSRYRPSGEALVRRVLQGKSLYQINTAVDLINLASMATGYSIGGFDAGRIQGDTLTLGIGRAGEPYEGIGRGRINVEGLPLYRDSLGGIGTPTTDHERTKLTLQTTRLLAIINAYDGRKEEALQCAHFIQRLLRDYAESNGGEAFVFTN